MYATVGMLRKDTESLTSCYPLSLVLKPQSVFNPHYVHNLPLGIHTALFGPRQIHNGSDYGSFLELSHYYRHLRNISSERIFRNSRTHSPLFFSPKQKAYFSGEEPWLGMIPGRNAKSPSRANQTLPAGCSHILSLLLIHQGTFHNICHFYTNKAQCSLLLIEQNNTRVP